MWNLDKQRQKKMTASKTTAKPAERSVEKSVDSEAAKAAPKPVAKHPEHAADAPKKKPAHHARSEGTSAEAQPKKHPKNVRLLHMLIQMRTLSETFLRSMSARKRKRQSARVMRKC